MNGDRESPHSEVGNLILCNFKINPTQFKDLA